MQSKELRIGNLVNYFNKDETLSIMFKFEFESGWNMDYIKPVIITKEWLLKFGFVETEKRTYELSQIPNKLGLMNNDIDLTVQIRELDLCVTLWQNDPVYLTYDFNKFFVHNLQNLYNALTGEELELKHESKP